MNQYRLETDDGDSIRFSAISDAAALEYAVDDLLDELDATNGGVYREEIPDEPRSAEEYIGEVSLPFSGDN
jgi:hypothetical protein